MKTKIRSLEDLIVFEDNRYIIINKPAFISSLDDRNDRVSILSLARDYDPEAQLCHRLDKETSGILVIARTTEAYRSMASQLEERQVSKIYHAVIEGLHDLKNVHVDAPLIISASGKVRIDRRNGKKASTVFNTLKVFKKHTLVSCSLNTGRMHQIRVHLSGVIAPICGDTMYEGKPFYLSSIKHNYHLGKNREEKPLIQRVALHALSIAFRLSDQSVHKFVAPYPKDFKALLNQLEKNL